MLDFQDLDETEIKTPITRNNIHNNENNFHEGSFSNIQFIIYSLSTNNIITVNCIFDVRKY